MVRVKDESGNRHGRLVVLSRSTSSKGGRARWRCKCDCGEVVVVSGKHLRSGNTNSCGCFMRSRSAEANIKHGMSGTSEYNTFLTMLDRCKNKNSKDFLRYGGRGIVVCDRWQPAINTDAFSNFLSDMGLRPSPSHSIDRIDNDGPYAPENCRWETPVGQGNNKRTNRRIHADGRTQTLAQWGRERGINSGTIYKRLKLGWTSAQALGFEKR